MLAGSVVGFGALTTAFWGAGHAAAFVAGSDLDARWPQGAVAMLRTLARPGDPEWAWRAQPDTFGSPTLYWIITGILLTVTVAGLLALWMWWTRFNVSLDRNERLGVVPEARMGAKAELAPIRIPKPVAGRFTIGRVMGHLVATETATTQTAKEVKGRAKNRLGDRTSVMIFGPTRSGKTATIVPGIIEWDFPAIISSVKDDLMKDTIKRRLEIGEVFLFDPFKVAHNVPDQVQRVSWSPISCAATTDGAIAAAQTLADAAAANDVTTGGFWSDRGMSVLWPLLFAAAHSGKTMTDIQRWLADHDASADDSDVMKILRRLKGEGQALGLQASIAMKGAESWINLDPKQRSDQMATAQSLVSCWNNLHAAAASSPALPAINIGKILSDRNTLYIVSPLGRGAQFAPLFGGLFGDLVRDQTYRVANASPTGTIGPLLAVLDEAANTPLRWLPDVASTCAGIGVQLVTVWQDRSQIDALYKEYSQSLLNNHATKIFFAGQTDKYTLEYASELCGEEDITSNSASADLNFGSGRKSASAQVVSKRLVPTDMLRMIPNGTALLIHNTLRPFHMVGRRMTEERTLSNYVVERKIEDDSDLQEDEPDDVIEVGLLGDPLIEQSTSLAARSREFVELLKAQPTKRKPLGAYKPSKKMRAAFKHAHVTLDDEIVAHLQATVGPNNEPPPFGSVTLEAVPDIPEPPAPRSPLGYD